MSERTRPDVEGLRKKWLGNFGQQGQVQLCDYILHLEGVLRDARDMLPTYEDTSGATAGLPEAVAIMAGNLERLAAERDEIHMHQLRAVAKTGEVLRDSAQLCDERDEALATVARLEKALRLEELAHAEASQVVTDMLAREAHK